MEGDQMKMREALEYVLQFDATDEAAEQDGLTDAERIAEYADHISECQKKARAALSEPARQCDVGTPEEQADRFIDYCCCKCDGSNCKHGLYEVDKCVLKWAQMPYAAQEGTWE